MSLDVASRFMLLLHEEEILNFCATCAQFFPTAEECIDYYNQKRCYDGKALVLPSQIVSPLLP